MEVTTIIGIVVAVIIILVGLRMVLRKPNDAAPSLESELHINEDCKQPVIPRHVRDQLRTDRESQEQERVEPNLTALDSVEVADEKQQKIEDVAAESNVVQSTELEHAAITQQTEKTETVASTESATESVKALDVQTEPTTQTQDSAKAESVRTKRKLSV
jgi:cell division protein ZipA